MRFLLLVLVLPLLAACGSMPASGPATSEIKSGGSSAIQPYAVIDLDSAMADMLAAYANDDFAERFTQRGHAPDLRIGVGDSIVVTIFEAASGGLFSGDPGSMGGASKNVTLPPQPVARDGTISVPYVGQVKAAGLTPAQVQASVEAGLRDKAIQPQVIVTVTQGSSTSVTVAGDVRSPGRIPLTLSGDRILDTIAASGGSSAPAYDTFVRLTRGSTSAVVNLARIVSDPTQNIYLWPDDQIFLRADPQIFTAFGATARNLSFPFETDRLTLAEAVGRAGGLLDSRADARGVFVFRYEEPEAYAALPGAKPADSGAHSAGVPVVYRLDLKEPQSMFAAQRFLMRDNDILYVSNAPITNLQKVLSTIGSGVGVASSSSGFARSFEN